MYRDHVKELNNVLPKQPFFFLKPPTTLLQPGEGPVIAPKGVNLHYEIELALIMGKKVTDFDAADEKGAIDAIDSKPCPSCLSSTCWPPSESIPMCILIAHGQATPSQST